MGKGRGPLGRKLKAPSDYLSNMLEKCLKRFQDTSELVNLAKRIFQKDQSVNKICSFLQSMKMLYKIILIIIRFHSFLTVKKLAS